MRTFFLFVVTLVVMILSSCSSYEIEDSENSSVFESQQKYEFSETKSSDICNASFASDSLIIQLREYNQEFISSKKVEETRGLKEKLNWIFIGLADLKGAVVGFSVGGFGGSVLLGFIYSAVCFLQLTLENSIGNNGTVANIMQMPKIELVYSNLQHQPLLYDNVMEESNDVMINFPINNMNAKKVGINHNMMLHLYSDEYYSDLHLMHMNQDMISSLNSINNPFTYFIKNYGIELKRNLKDSYSPLYVSGYDKEYEVLSLFMEAVNNASDMKDVNTIANKYINLVHSDYTLSGDGRNLIYSSISTGVYSMSFWNRYFETYSISDTNDQ